MESNMAVPIINVGKTQVGLSSLKAAYCQMINLDNSLDLMLEH